MTAEEIEAKVREKVRLAMKDAAYEVSFEIESAYESAIDAFYNSYTPRSYYRNYYTYTGSDSCNNYSKNIEWNDEEFKAGIKVSGDFVKGSYKDPTDYVFNRSYFYGIHGTIRTGGVMVVPPERLMQMSFDGIKENLGTYVNKSLKKYFKHF